MRGRNPAVSVLVAFLYGWNMVISPIHLTYGTLLVLTGVKKVTLTSNYFFWFFVLYIAFSILLVTVAKKAKVRTHAVSLLLSGYMVPLLLFLCFSLFTSNSARSMGLPVRQIILDGRNTDAVASQILSDCKISSAELFRKTVLWFRFLFQATPTAFWVFAFVVAAFSYSPKHLEAAP